MSGEGGRRLSSIVCVATLARGAMETHDGGNTTLLVFRIAIVAGTIESGSFKDESTIESNLEPHSIGSSMGDVDDCRFLGQDEARIGTLHREEEEFQLVERSLSRPFLRSDQAGINDC